MIKSFYQRTLVAALSMFASSIAFSATANQTTDSKNITEVTVSGQQNASHWFISESPHFIVYSDTSTDSVSKLLNKLERLDYLLRLYTPNDNKNDAGPKLTLYYLKNFSAIRPFESPRPDYAIGLYNSCALGVQGFATYMFYGEKNNALLEKQPENEGLSYIFEAYARHFIYHNSNLRTPTWYIDGFAQYFASTRFSDAETVLGMAPASIGEYLGSLHSTGRYNSLDYKDILLQNDSNSRSLAGTAGVKLEFEARSWIFTHYILSSSDNIQKFRKYVGLITQDVEPTKAFQQSFGFTISELSKVLWRYKWQSAQALKTNLKTGSAPDISFTSLPITVDNLILAEAALKSCPSPELGNTLLDNIRKEAKKYPNSDMAQIILSRAEIDWGNAENALTYLAPKAQEKAPDFDALYLLGRAQLRLAEQAQGDMQKTYLADAQRNLLRAITLNQQAPEAFHAYFTAGVRAQSTPSEQTLGAAILAWKLAREVNTYSKSAALTYAYLGRKTEALDALAILLHNSRDPHMTEWAKSWQQRLTTATQAELLSEMRSAPLADSSFKEWTIATADVMKAVSLAAGLQAAQNQILDQQQQDQQKQMQTQNTNGQK